MTQVTASVQSPKITASVSGGQITATVGSRPIAASAVGGIGPQGPSGPIGPPGNALSAAADVELLSPADGDVLRYSSSRWRNYSEKNLTDGGHF